jgi:hypothetical protein
MMLVRGRCLNNIQCKNEAQVSQREKPVYGSCRLLIETFRFNDEWFRSNPIVQKKGLTEIQAILEISYLIEEESFSSKLVTDMKSGERYEITLDASHIFFNPKHRSKRVKSTLFVYAKIFASHISFIQNIGTAQIPEKDKVESISAIDIINRMVDLSQNSTVKLAPLTVNSK